MLNKIEIMAFLIAFLLLIVGVVCLNVGSAIESNNIWACGVLFMLCSIPAGILLLIEGGE
jgi:hypothetical protein